MASSEPASARREPMDLSLRAVLWTTGGTAAFLLASLAGLYVFWRLAQEPRSFPLPRQFGPPALQSDTAGDLRDFMARQRAALEGFAWVDRERGRVRIPVERAMAILAARGQAGWDPLQPAPQPAKAARR